MTVEVIRLVKTDEECLGKIICDHPDCKVPAEWRMSDPRWPYDAKYFCDPHKLWGEREF